MGAMATVEMFSLRNVPYASQREQMLLRSPRVCNEVAKDKHGHNAEGD